MDGRRPGIAVIAGTAHKTRHTRCGTPSHPRFTVITLAAGQFVPVTGEFLPRVVSQRRRLDTPVSLSNTFQHSVRGRENEGGEWYFDGQRRRRATEERTKREPSPVLDGIGASMLRTFRGTVFYNRCRQPPHVQTVLYLCRDACTYHVA